MFIDSCIYVTCCIVGFYVQSYQGQRILKWSNNGFKVEQLAFTASKIITSMAFIYILFPMDRSIMYRIPTRCQFARHNLCMFGKNLESKKTGYKE